MNASLKIQQIEKKIADFQEKHNRLLEQRQKDISALIATLNLSHIDNKTLMGGLIFLREKITTEDPMVEVWRDVGGRFLRRTGKEKSRSFKTLTTPHPTNKSS
ncbi:MAG: hypothetical protein HOL16_01825 [Alphaproteobacteria bacterium]|jgi:hypothetical protein|nr:hypothetical protein [Alphaproteobacteria bacterium]